MVEYILEYFGINKIQLLTNNPTKIDSLKNIEITKRIPIVVDANPYNEEYLQVKKKQMGHLL